MKQRRGESYRKISIDSRLNRDEQRLPLWIRSFSGSIRAELGGGPKTSVEITTICGISLANGIASLQSGLVSGQRNFEWLSGGNSLLAPRWQPT